MHVATMRQDFDDGIYWDVLPTCSDISRALKFQDTVIFMAKVGVHGVA